MEVVRSSKSGAILQKLLCSQELFDEFPAGRPILIMTIEIGDGRSGKIEVQMGDDPVQLASTFCVVHNLSVEDVVIPLSENIRKNITQIRPQADLPQGKSARPDAFVNGANEGKDSTEPKEEHQHRQEIGHAGTQDAITTKRTAETGDAGGGGGSEVSKSKEKEVFSSSSTSLKSIKSSKSREVDHQDILRPQSAPRAAQRYSDGQNNWRPYSSRSKSAPKSRDSSGPVQEVCSEDSFGRKISERLYDKAQSKQERLQRKREELESHRREEEKRMGNGSVHVNRKSLAIVAGKRGNQNIFLRLYDEGKKVDAKKEEKREQTKHEREQTEFGERESTFLKGQKIEPFHPDIGPRAKNLERQGSLLDHLDAAGTKKKLELQQREAVRRAKLLEGCTFQPAICKDYFESKHLKRKQDSKSVHEDLYEEGLSRRMRRMETEINTWKHWTANGGNHSSRGISTDLADLVLFDKIPGLDLQCATFKARGISDGSNAESSQISKQELKALMQKEASLKQSVMSKVLEIQEPKDQMQRQQVSGKDITKDPINIDMNNTVRKPQQILDQWKVDKIDELFRILSHSDEIKVSTLIGNAEVSRVLIPVLQSAGYDRTNLNFQQFKDICFERFRHKSKDGNTPWQVILAQPLMHVANAMSRKAREDCSPVHSISNHSDGFVWSPEKKNTSGRRETSPQSRTDLRNRVGSLYRCDPSSACNRSQPFALEAQIIFNPFDAHHEAPLEERTGSSSSKPAVDERANAKARREQRHEARLQATIRRNNEKEMAECTFRPKINAPFSLQKGAVSQQGSSFKQHSEKIQYARKVQDT